jgi:hypothetical protein
MPITSATKKPRQPRQPLCLICLLPSKDEGIENIGTACNTQVLLYSYFQADDKCLYIPELSGVLLDLSPFMSVRLQG